MTPDEYKHGRDNFWVQFTCGALLGIFVGIYLWRRFVFSFAIGALVFLAAVGGCALVAGFWGDRFWEALLRIWSGTRRR